MKRNELPINTKTLSHEKEAQFHLYEILNLMKQ
jgi:hypothetical protein